MEIGGIEQPRTEMATIDLQATIAAMSYSPNDLEGSEIELLLVAVQQKPLLILSASRGNRRSVLLADKIELLSAYV